MRRSKVQGSQAPWVPKSQCPKDQDISKSHSDTSLTLKKVHLVKCPKLSILDFLSINKMNDKALQGKGLAYRLLSNYFHFSCFN